MAMIDDGLDLVFFLSIDDVWGGTREIIPVLMGFLERRQKPGVKYVVDGPGWG